MTLAKLSVTTYQGFSFIRFLITCSFPIKLSPGASPTSRLFQALQAIVYMLINVLLASLHFLVPKPCPGLYVFVMAAPLFQGPQVSISYWFPWVQYLLSHSFWGQEFRRRLAESFWLSASHVVFVRILAEVEVIRRSAWDGRTCFQDDSPTWILAGSLPSSPLGPRLSLLKCHLDMAAGFPQSKWHKRGLLYTLTGVILVVVWGAKGRNGGLIRKLIKWCEQEMMFAWTGKEVVDNGGGCSDPGYSW